MLSLRESTWFSWSNFHLLLRQGYKERILQYKNCNSANMMTDGNWNLLQHWGDKNEQKRLVKWTVYAHLNWSHTQRLSLVPWSPEGRGVVRPYAFLKGAWKSEYLCISSWRLKIFQKSLWAKTNIYNLNLSPQASSVYWPQTKSSFLLFQAFAHALHSARIFSLPGPSPSSQLTTVILLVFTQSPLLPNRFSWSDKLG